MFKREQASYDAANAKLVGLRQVLRPDTSKHVPLKLSLVPRELAGHLGELDDWMATTRRWLDECNETLSAHLGTRLAMEEAETLLGWFRDFRAKLAEYVFDSRSTLARLDAETHVGAQLRQEPLPGFRSWRAHARDFAC